MHECTFEEMGAWSNKGQGVYADGLFYAFASALLFCFSRISSIAKKGGEIRKGIKIEKYVKQKRKRFVL